MITDFLSSLYCWAVIAAFTIILGILAVITSFFSANASRKIAKLWGVLILKACSVKVDITGSENLSPENSYIITSNHQSYFDIFVLLAYLNIKFGFIAKKSLFNIPFLGWSMKRLGYISIDRENLRSALKSVKKSTELLKNKTSILIFPEGTRSSDGNLSSFKKGGFNMFLKQGNMTVLPVVIKGTINILRKKSLTVHPGKTVELHILKPLNAAEKGDSNIIIEKIEQETRAILEN
ncbi:MAG: 1-acyl-sn-glycerol-3-phosphate acyltransferase [Deltaproteobacteria bacterium]|nr:1-acyl-sn-glycerol-3-phosphate acyltransferase [Deltaproteobacteria bacterium]